MNTYEVLVDAIAKFNGIHSPESEAYQIKNPLLIRSFARPGKHQIDDHGRRVFPSMLNGYKAALYDMELKVNGASRAGLKKEDQLQNLFRVYGISEPAGQQMSLRFVRQALKNQDITLQTPLSFFTANVEETE